MLKIRIREIYDYVLAKGIAMDPRGVDLVNRQLDKEKKRFDLLTEEQKSDYDQDRLTNPYSDTRLLCGDPDQEVKRILAGIDMEVGEVLLADRLNEKGRAIDLVLAHHPEGKALAALYDVMHLQEDWLAGQGVPINVAEGIMSSRINEVKRGILPVNHSRAVDAAKILGLSMMCTHTVADNQVNSYLQKTMDDEQPETLEDIIKLLKKAPEYAYAAKHYAGPTIVVGSKDRRAGKIVVDMTGGTGGSEHAYEKLAQAGIGTVLVMHIGEKHRKKAEKNHINIIVAGHIASDSLGMNLLLDGLEKQGVEIIPCAGFIRHRRD